MRPNKNTKKILVWIFWKPGNVPYLVPWGCQCLFGFISGPHDASRIITLKHHSLSKVPFSQKSSWPKRTQGAESKYNYDKECIQHGANVLKMTGTFKRIYQMAPSSASQKEARRLHFKAINAASGSWKFQWESNQTKFFLRKFGLLDMLDTSSLLHSLLSSCE